MRLVGTHEIRGRLGTISRQRAHQIVSRSDFPTPVAVLAQGRIWDADTVDAWIREHRADAAETRLP